jgi:Ni/Co efflux regulator RcnB
MKRIALSTVLATIVAAGLASSASAATTSQNAPLREFEGRVVSVDRDSRTFRLHDSERGTKRIRVTRGTRFERVAGLAGLKVGQRFIEVKTRRKVDGAWIAIEVEKSGGGGEHGGRDDDDDRDDDGGRRGRGGDDD